MAKTHEEWRKHPYYKLDPLTEIQPALLNSFDINRYVDMGCLVEKDNFDPKMRLKPASYEMRFLGKLYDWRRIDGRLQRRCREIHDGKKIKLSRNSITYLWMKEKLLLPEYIAARFNLHIRHVHSGMLLGTGPLIDPGFFGNLLIPLHNLTCNDYQLEGGKGIIWVEFTKVSKNKYWLNDDAERPLALKEFPRTKDLDNPGSYFEKSGVTETDGVQSAFKEVLEKAQSDADDARKSATETREEVRRLKTLYSWIGLGSAVSVVITIVIAAVAAIIGGYTLVNQVVEISTEAHRQIKIDKEVHLEKIDIIQKDLSNLDTKIDKYQDEVEILKRKLDLTNKEYDAGHNIEQ